MGLGEKLISLRKKARMTQEGLSKAIGSNVPTLWRWEKNLSEPRASDLQKIAEVLGCTESELLNGAPDEGEIRFSFVMNISEVGMMEIAMNEFKFGTGDKDMFGMFRIPKDTDPAEIGRLVERHIRAEQAGDAVKRAKLKEMEG